MINNLYILLWVVCFYDAIVLLLLPSTTNLMMSADGSTARFVVDLVCLIIFGYVLINQGIKKIENKWIIAFLLLLIISHFHSPNINIESSFLPHDMAIYNYKPLFESVLFFLLFLGVSSIDLTNESFHKITQSLCLIAVIYAGYILLQRIGLDQLYALSKEQRLEWMSRNPECGGFISQPVFAAAFLSMCVPFVIKYGKYWMMGLIALALIATGNRSACIASAIVSMMMFAKTVKIGIICLFIYLGFMLSTLLIHCALPHFDLKFAYNDRLDTWKNLFYDFVNPTFPGVSKHYILTGHGIGSFPVLFPFYHNSVYYQAHNELFELIWATGLCGLIVLIGMIRNLLRHVMSLPVALGLLAIGICSMTNPVLHIPQLQFLTVFLIGLAYNKNTGVNYVQ